MKLHSLLTCFLCIFVTRAILPAADLDARAGLPALQAAALPARTRAVVGYRSDKPVVYKTTAQGPLNLSIYKPADWNASDRRAAMVFIHGGGWTKGSPGAGRPWAEALCARGMVVFSVEYRLAESGPNLNPGACIEDAKSALRYVRSHAAELGIDPGRIAAAGSSAGGHLAAACALLPGFETDEDSGAISCRPDALVLLQPVIDNGPDGGYGYTAPIIKADHARFSPAHHVAPAAPPTIVFGGRGDRAAKLDLLKRFTAAMQKEGNDCVLHEYDGVHGFVSEPTVLPDIESKVISFFARLGWLAAAESAPRADPANGTSSKVDKRDASGVWLQINHNQTFDNDLKDLRYYKGVMFSKAWSEIEPMEGVFEWKQLDAKLEQAARLGLYYGIGIPGGPLGPSWLYKHGVPRVMTEGHVRDGPYPYYLDAHYEFYYHRFLEEFGRHIRSLPAHLTDRMICVLVMTGSTQDEAPYKGVPTPAKYAISQSEWLKFRLAAFAKYNAAFQEGPGPAIPLLFNGLMSWSGEGTTAHDWVKAHVKGGWGHKASIGHFYQLNGESERIKEYRPPVIDPAPGGNEFSFVRCEMDVTWKKAIFQTNVAMNFYWTALSALHNGLGTWHLTSSAREWCHENNYWEFVEFFNKYAGQNRSPEATGAFCALREGLNAADTVKFPEETYGKADLKNKARYLAICNAYASRGAKMDSVEAVLNGQGNQRNAQKGLNDAGWEVLDGNYERFLHQIDPEKSSIGWWRVGGAVTPSTPVYARFARGFEHASGKDAMYFDIKDTLFQEKPLNGQYPVTVRVVYYDQGTGQWELQYDAVGDAKKTAYVIRKTDTGTWKEKTVTLKDACFGNRGPNGADLVLVNVDAEDDIFHMVEVTKGDGRGGVDTR